MTRFKGVLVPGLHRPEGVIDQSVMSLIGPDGQNDVTHHGILGKLPVVNGQRRSGQSFPHWQVPLVQLLQDVSVCYDGLLFEIANESEYNFKVYFSFQTAILANQSKLANCKLSREWWKSKDVGSNLIQNVIAKIGSIYVPKSSLVEIYDKKHLHERNSNNPETPLINIYSRYAHLEVLICLSSVC